MSRLRFTGAVGTLLVALLVVASLVTVGWTLVGDAASMAGLLLVLVVFFVLGTYGGRFARDGTPYW